MYHNYSIHDQHLSSATQYTDLSVLIDSFFSRDTHVQNTVWNASKLFEMIVITFRSQNLAFLVRVLFTYIRLVFKYTSTVWSLFSIACSTMLETVQRTFTCHFLGMVKIDYKQRFSELNLSSLHYRRIYNDMLLVNAVLHYRTNIAAGNICIAFDCRP